MQENEAASLALEGLTRCEQNLGRRRSGESRLRETEATSDSRGEAPVDKRNLGHEGRGWESCVAQQSRKRRERRAGTREMRVIADDAVRLWRDAGEKGG